MTLLTPKEVAETLGISYEKAMEIMKTEMRTVMVGKRIRVNQDEINAWYERRARIQSPAIIAPSANRIERKKYA